jgi:hypothetical protein
MIILSATAAVVVQNERVFNASNKLITYIIIAIIIIII